ncbi:MAG: NUDIX domain-containing protein, partial [Bacteroidota bacterium]
LTAQVNGAAGESRTALIFNKYSAIFVTCLSIYGRKFMKIFANNFALSLQIEPTHAHFRMERHSLSAVVARLRAQDLLFEEEVFYVTAPDVENLAAFEEEVYALHADVEIAAMRATVALVFADETARTAFWMRYQSRFKAVAAAGGLVLNPHDELLMMVRDAKWDLPKGKVDPGETVAEAAWREVAEETSLKAHVTGEKCCETFHIFPRKGKPWRLKTTHWFHMQSPEREATAPQEIEGITEIRWTPLAELRKEIPQTYPQIMDLVRQVLLANVNAQQ